MSNRGLRFSASLGSIIVYAVMFILTYPFEGDIAGMWTTLPAVAAGWFLGMRAAALFALFSIGSNLILYALVGSPSANDPALHIVGAVGVLAIGGATGWVKGLLNQLRKQTSELERERETLQHEIAKRRQVEAALQKAKEDLEITVDERTAQLTDSHRQLQVELAERQRVEEETRQQTAKLQVLGQIGMGLVAELDRDQLLQSIVSSAKELIGCRTASCYLYRPDRDVLERVIFAGEVLVVSQKTRQRGQGLIGKVWATGNPMVVNDYRQWEQRTTSYDSAPSRNVMAVPIRWGKEFLGVLNVVADLVRPFTPADVELLCLFAAQAAVALENARLFDELTKEKTRLETLYHLSRELPTSLNVRTVAQRALADVSAFIGAKQGLVFVSQASTRQLRLVAASGYRPQPEEVMEGRFELPFGTGLIGWVAANLESARVDNVTEDKRWYPVPGVDDWVRSALSVPLVSRNELVGVLVFADDAVGSFSDDHRQLAESIAAIIAVTLSNAQLYEQAQQEIAERKRAEEQLAHSAFHDPLTGLPNRALFMDRLERAVERAKRRKEYIFAVLYLDLDRFKVVNDSLGHTIGDQLLIECARRLETCIRTVDTVARLGGDEFVLLLEDIQDITDATRVADRIQHDLAQPCDLDDHRLFVSVSIGVILSASRYEQPADILRDVDLAMYRAKALGRGRYEVFDVAMRERALTLLELESDLRRALECKEFFLHYQPILSLATNRIVGFEALVRWQHPDRGVVAPAEFIPMAEETGLIIPMGHWVLYEACHQLREWQTAFPMNPPLTVSVNLSVKQFMQADLIERISAVLAQLGLDTGSLKLELTESIIVEDAEAIKATLSKLRALGIQVQIDDFGTGYSSLSYLQHLPIDTLKIDRTFVSRIGSEGNGSEIVQTILTLAHDLGMKVVAEGVETRDQLTKLQGLHCEYGQGYLWAKPVDSTTATAIIADALAVT